VDYVDQVGTSIKHFLMNYAPDATTVSGMIFYSFFVFLIINCIRKIKHETLYPQLAKSMNEASNKQRAEIRKKRDEEARKLAEKLG